MLAQKEKTAEGKPTPGGNNTVWLSWLAAWLLGIAAMGVLLSAQFPAQAALTLDADHLAANKFQAGDVTGFYKPEKDDLKNRFVWTTGQSDLRLNFTSQAEIKLVVELRSAASFGGKDEPVRVSVNGQEIAQFRPVPSNPDFQTFEVSFSPAGLARPLDVRLDAATFSPPDKRVLGTMVRTIRLESAVWPSLRNWVTKPAWVLLIGLLIPAALMGTLARRKIKQAGPFTARLSVAGLGIIGFIAWTLGPLWLWLPADPDHRNPYTLISLALLYLAGLLTAWLVWTPQWENSSLYQWAYRRLGFHSRVTPRERLQPLPALTGLRIIAAGLVFCFHSRYLLNLPEWLDNLFHSGNIGVPLFFTLSGFVICYNYFRPLTSSPTRQIGPYLLARVARIYPMYLLTLLLAMALAGFDDPGRRDLLNISQYGAVIQSWNPDIDLFDLFVYNGQAWTLTVEFFLYACFPLIAWFLIARLPKMWELLLLAALAYILAVVGASWFWAHDQLLNGEAVVYWTNHFPPIHLADFIVGCVAARLYVRLKGRAVSALESWLGNLLLLAAFAGITWLMIQNSQPWQEPYRYDLLYLPFFIVIIFCLARYPGPLQWLFSRRPIVLLGEASYAFYLLHEFFLVGRKPLADDGQTGLMLAGLFAACAVVSILSFYLYESPVRRLIHRLAPPPR